MTLAHFCTKAQVGYQPQTFATFTFEDSGFIIQWRLLVDGDWAVVRCAACGNGVVRQHLRVRVGGHDVVDLKADATKNQIEIERVLGQQCKLKQNI